MLGLNWTFLLSSTIVVLMITKNNEIRGEDTCKPDNSTGEQQETYRSGLERLLQNLGGAFKTVTGGIGGGGGSSIISDTFSAVLEPFRGQIHAILPGTLWCGSGNVAPNGSYLGPLKLTDACCRSHDECATNIRSGHSYGQLKNNGLFTRSACGCDHAFYQCLKRANTIVSNGIGDTYFNVLRPQCFTCDYPIVNCTKKDKKRLVDKKCTSYTLDKSKGRTIQWFDNPDF